MNTVILWKEFRQQRSTWIAVTILAVLLVEGILLTIGPGTMQQGREGELKTFPAIVILGTIIAYGIISGAQLFAAEKEEGTLEFLDNLTGQRRPLWRSKLCAGVLLTLSQCLVMAGYFVARDVATWQFTILMPPLMLSAFGWGLLGGVLCRQVLIAILTGMALMGASWALCFPLNALSPVTGAPLWIFAAEFGASLAATLLARRILCRSDRQRGRAIQERWNPHYLPLISSWQAVFWLVNRQGRWILIGLVAAGVALAFVANSAPIIIWPMGTSMLGLACGLAVYCPDQHSGRLFWGAQGFSRNRIWYAKIFAWLVILLVVLNLTWCIITARSNLDPFRVTAALDHWQGPAFDEPGRRLDPVLFMVLGPVQGFCIGLFLGQVMRRPVLALIWGVMVAPVVAALWLPSFLIGGLPLWQVCAVPLVLLLTSRLTQRSWVSDRLWNAKSLAKIVVTVLLMIGWTAGCLWYRVLEVPDVGEPFDVRAFVAKLPDAEANGYWNFKDLEVLGTTVHTMQELETNRTPRGDITDLLYENQTETQLLKQYPRMGERLESIFGTDSSAAMWKNAAAMPLGLVRRSGLDVSPHASLHVDSTLLIRLTIRLRACQLEERGDLKGALDLFETALGIARQIERNAPLEEFRAGVTLEGTVLTTGLDRWLRKAGSDKALLEAAQHMLQQHETASPDPASAIKAEYFTQRNMDPFTTRSASVLDSKYRKVAVEVPWEKERQRRVFDAVTVGALEAVHAPYYRALQSYAVADDFTNAAIRDGLPTKLGPGSKLSAERWGALILQSWPVLRSNYATIVTLAAQRAANLQSAQVAVALRRYQIDNGRFPGTLEELVPAYLPALPRQTGLPTDYSLEETEEFVVPILASNFITVGLPSETAYWDFADALRKLCERDPNFSFYRSESTGGGAGSAPAMGAAKVMAMGGGPPAVDPSLPLLAPHAVIGVGKHTRVVSAVR